MTRATTIDDTTRRYAQKLCIAPSSVGQMKKALCVTLAATFCADAGAIANLLGIDRSTVFRYHDEIRKEANGLTKSTIIRWGGRRKSLMTEDDEVAFLEKWKEALSQAKQ